MNVYPAWSRYEKIRVLGSGAAGTVYLVRTLEAISESIPAGIYVDKRIAVGVSPEMLRSAATEVKIMERIEPHDNLVRYYEHFFDDEGSINIIMEYCAGGDLSSALGARAKRRVLLSGAEVVFCAFQLFAAVRHLHHAGVLHRDIKPANILISTVPNHSGDTAAPEDNAVIDFRRCILKLSDFSISRIFEKTGSVAHTVVGTPFYISPEQCNGVAYTSAADMWALGCVIYELASTGKRCFHGDNLLAVVRAITSGVVPPLPDDRMRDLIMPMITPLLLTDPHLRFSAEDCLRAFFLPDADDCEHCEEEFQDPSEFM